MYLHIYTDSILYVYIYMCFLYNYSIYTVCIQYIYSIYTVYIQYIYSIYTVYIYIYTVYIQYIYIYTVYIYSIYVQCIYICSIFIYICSIYIYIYIAQLIHNWVDWFMLDKSRVNVFVFNKPTLNLGAPPRIFAGWCSPIKLQIM